MAEPITHKAKEEINTLADKDADSTDDNIRYMAYGARLRTALRAGHRYIAYVRLPLPSLRQLLGDKSYFRLVISVKLSGQSFPPPLSPRPMESLGCI